MRAVTTQIPTVTSHAMRFRRDTQRLLSRTRMTMTADLSLAYVKALSADYRAGVILDAQGAVLAGDERLAPPTRHLVANAHGQDGEPVAFEGEAGRSKVFARHAHTLTILITTGPFALSRVTHRDLATALAAMGAESAQETRVQRIPHGTVEAL